EAPDVGLRRSARFEAMAQGSDRLAIRAPAGEVEGAVAAAATYPLWPAAGRADDKYVRPPGQVGIGLRVGGEGDAPPVGAPCRVFVARITIGQPRKPSAVDIGQP